MMGRVGKGIILSGFRALEGRRIQSIYPLSPRYKQIPETSSHWNSERWSVFPFHVNNRHRSQHKLAHKDTKIIKIATGIEDERLPLLKPKTRKEVIKKKITTFLNFFYEPWLRFLYRSMGYIEKKFPRFPIQRVYRVCVVGFKDFMFEAKDFVILKKRVMFNSLQMEEMSKKEIEMYYRMPGEMRRAGPFLLISSLPFVDYVLLPFAFYFPKQVLSSHFWTPQQKSQFAIELQTERLTSYQPVFRHLQLNVEDIKDTKLRASAQSVLSQLGSGSHPSVREIMTIKPLFEYDVFSLKSMHDRHIKALCRVHGIHTLYFKRRRLAERAKMLHNMDTVLLREGLLGLTSDELKNACYIRGLNGANASRRDMMEFMQQWMSVSTSIHPHAYSLLLHLPIFLAYNHPNNWFLPNESLSLTKMCCSSTNCIYQR